MTNPDHESATPQVGFRILPDGPPLPEMREALLTHDEVSALVADLQAHTRITSTICKSRAQRHTPPDDFPLTAAIEQLFARTVVAVQIRYCYDGHEWTDTLLRLPTGIRLVRCRHVQAETGSG